MSAKERSAVIPVDHLHPSVRLAFLLPQMEAITVRMDVERNLRDHNERVIENAVKYLPPFAQEIQAELSDTAILLVTRGHQQKDHKRELAEKVAEVLHDPFDVRPHVEFSPTYIARQVSRLIHPDTADELVREIFPENILNNTFEKTLQAVEQNSSQKSAEAFLEIAPHYFFAKVITLLDKGKSWDEIVDCNPEIVPQMEYVRALANVSLPKVVKYRRFATQEDADEKAEEMKARDDQHGSTYAFIAIQSIIIDTHALLTDRGNPPSWNYGHLIVLMKDIEGYLGGANEFIWKNRLADRWDIPRLRGLIEAQIRTMPPLVHSMVDLYTTDDADQAQAIEAFEAFRLSVIELGQRVERLISDIEARINPAYSREPSRINDGNTYIINKDLLREKKEYYNSNC